MKGLAELDIQNGPKTPRWGLTDAAHANVLPVVFLEELNTLRRAVVRVVVDVIPKQVQRGEDCLQNQRQTHLRNVVALLFGCAELLGDQVTDDRGESEEHGHGTDVTSEPGAIRTSWGWLGNASSVHRGEGLIFHDTCRAVDNEGGHEFWDFDVCVGCGAYSCACIGGSVGATIHQPDPKKLWGAEKLRRRSHHLLERALHGFPKLCFARSILGQRTINGRDDRSNRTTRNCPSKHIPK
mmetsp:Transcript_7203/g.13658  ORF Transcript_7203/g.13658 Transcript_7203/m.13658 type:complete len:239 (-) Transcript_7203:39-755(-)